MKVWFEISNPKYVHFLRFFGHVEIIRFKMLTKQQIKKASMEWVQKKARLSCLLRLQCLTATPHRGHLKPVPPIPPSCLPTQVTGSVFLSILTTRHCVNTDPAFTDCALRTAFLFFKSPWNYEGVSTP